MVDIIVIYRILDVSWRTISSKMSLNIEHVYQLIQNEDVEKIQI